LFHLLTHTSGATDEERPHGGQPSRVRLQSAPGREWTYCNLGYQLAGLVLERATGHQYERLLIDEVLTPLGLASTSVATHEASRPEWSCEHVTVAGRQVPHATDRAFLRFAGGVRTVAPAGAVVSSAKDLVRLALASCGNGPSAQIWNQTVPTGRPGLSYGLGVFVRTLKSGPMVYHHGNTGTSAAELYWLPARHVAAATLANTSRPLRSTIVAALNHIGGVPMEVLRKSLAAVR
jgi:CubicO group peptidase (beta-lactamase class C family)